MFGLGKRNSKRPIKKLTTTFTDPVERVDGMLRFRSTTDFHAFIALTLTALDYRWSEAGYDLSEVCRLVDTDESPDVFSVSEDTDVIMDRITNAVGTINVFAEVEEEMDEWD